MISGSVDVASLRGRHETQRWNRVSVGDLCERLTWSCPDKDAVVGGPGAYADPRHSRLTYREVDELANRVANALTVRGLRSGDRVLLFCENSVEAMVTKLGIAKAGMVCAPVNPSLAPDVVSYLIDHVEARFAFVDAEFWAVVEGSFTDAGVTPIVLPIGGSVPAGAQTWASFIDGVSAGEPDVAIHGDDIWQILFTSGTTSMPKGVMVSHHYSYLAAYSFALPLTRGVRFESDMVLGTFLPVIYHIGDQLMLSAFLSGGTLILGRRPVADHIAEAITRESISALWAGSPAMVNALADALTADQVRYDPRSLRVLVYGWAALAPGTVARLKRLCGEELQPMEILGQTEAISCHRFWVDQWRETFLRTAPEQNYVGLPSPLLAARIVDEQGNTLADKPGTPGEAVYRSPAVAAGYYRNEAATREAFRDGWFHSGDSCCYDADGLRVMVDRYKDIVKSGGENVSSLRVESVLHQHPAVAKAAVVGLPNERWGEAVTAFVIAAPGRPPAEADIVEFCRERLAGFETPKRVVLVDALPETVGGKVLKYKLREANQDLHA